MRFPGVNEGLRRGGVQPWFRPPGGLLGEQLQADAINLGGAAWRSLDPARGRYVRAQLIEIYRDDIEALEGLLGWDLSTWRS